MTLVLRTLLLLVVCAAPLAAQGDAPAPAPNRIEALLSAGRDTARAQAAEPGIAPERKAELEARAERLGRVLAAPDEYRAQILLGEVNEVDGKPALRQTGWRADAEYFYPASTVKLFGAIAALERMNELARTVAPKLTVDTPLAFHAIKRDRPLLAEDPDNLDGGKLTLRHLIRETFLISDNEAFNRLYDFCGRDRLNQRMWRAGLGSVRVAHRLAVRLGPNENLRTPLIELRLPEGPLLLGQEHGTLDLALADLGPSVLVGRQRMENGERVDGPLSFYARNRASLADLQLALALVVRPELRRRGEPFDLTDAQRALLLDAASEYPGDSANPRYDRAKYPDEYCKFFLPGLTRVVPKERLKVFNKVGLAFGFVVDTAYVVDTHSGRGFFLAATLYANSDGVVDDDAYDYETLAFPWFADVAELVARDVFAAK